MPPSTPDSLPAIPAAADVVVSALTRSLRALFGAEAVAGDLAPGTARFRVVSYARAFGSLWGLDRDTGPLAISTETTLVVVWDGLPPRPEYSPVSVEPYLTPLDWGVHLSLESHDSGTRPPLRVYVVDLVSHLFPHAPAVGFFALFGGNAPLPWLRVVSPVSGLAEIARQQIPTLQSSPPAPAEVLRRMWAGTLARPPEVGGHHGIANLIGPLLLTGGMTGDAHAAAMHCLLVRVGLAPQVTIQEEERKEESTEEPGKRQPGGGIPWSRNLWTQLVSHLRDASAYRESKSREMKVRETNFLLVDDRAFDTGWADVVRVLLGADDSDALDATPTIPARVGTREHQSWVGHLFATSDPACWLEVAGLIRPVGEKTAQPSADAPQGPPDLRFAFPLGREPDGTPRPVDVLFLDLRLFQGQPVQTEGAFYARLLPVAEWFVTDPASQFPWPGFTRAELDDIKGWVADAALGEAELEGTRYDLVLTLLPRLIALVDPGLPIILFSSTGRRGVVNRLRDYSTIITRFEKPRLGGSDNPAEEARHQFAEALERAMEFAAARALAARIATETEKARIRPLPAQAGTWRVELATDESGNTNPRLAMGGVLAIFPPGLDPDVLDKKLGTGVPGVNWLSKADIRRKRNQIAQFLATDPDWQRVTIQVVMILGRLTAHGTRFTSLTKSDELHDERVGDNLFRHLFRGLFEFAIYGAARAFIPSDAPCVFSVRAASRVRQLDPDKPPDANKKQRAAEALFNRWGIETDVKENIARHFEPKDARPLVEEVMELYDGSMFHPLADIVRAYRINTATSPDVPLVRFLHRFTDAVVSEDSDAEKGPEIKQLDANRFRCVYPDPLLALLAGQQAFAHNRFGEALALAGLAWFKDQERDQFLKAPAAWLHKATCWMTGPQFVEFASAVRRSEPTAESNKPLIGEVVAVESDRALIHDGESDFYVDLKSKESLATGLVLKPGDRVTFHGQRSNAPGVMLATKVQHLDATTEGSATP